MSINYFYCEQCGNTIHTTGNWPIVHCYNCPDEPEIKRVNERIPELLAELTALRAENEALKKWKEAAIDEYPCPCQNTPCPNMDISCRVCIDEAITRVADEKLSEKAKGESDDHR